MDTVLFNNFLGRKEWLNPFNDDIHLIIFVLRKDRYTPEENTAIKFVQNYCDNISPISALVLTNCEQKDKKSRSKIIQDLRSDPLTKPTAEFFKAGIYTVGFPPKSDYMNLPKPIKDCYQQFIDKDKEQLWSLIKRSSEARHSKHLFNIEERKPECTII